ncbi:MAG TPA: hypothetical protein PKD26_03285 [Pyrinomonadaceae bacterium]|nr:hypothetical protein [Pyrinomonadaceae bacterium]
MNYFNYYTEIEETFVRRRGKNLLLSPLDWALMEAWQERGIPLHVAIRAIENVFDSFDKKPTKRSIKGLLYCREEIEAQYEEWVTSQAGKANGDTGTQIAPEFSIEEHLEEMISRLKGVASDLIAVDVERAISRLAELKDAPGDDPEHVDRSLADIETMLSASMFENTSPAELEAARQEVANQLRPYRSSMDEESYKRTFELMLLKQLRELYGLPRLTLFNL